MSDPVPGPVSSGPEHFRLAHLSDPHLTSLDRVRWHELLNKRLLGYLSWSVRRRHVHRPEILQALCTDLKRQQPDHVAVTGDLTQLGTVSECRQASDWLRQLASPADLTLIPGNHDRYVAAGWQGTVGQWRDFLHGDRPPDPNTPEQLFPTLTIRGRLAMIGLSSALPTAPFLASGRLGQAQLDRLRDMLEDTGRQGYFRVVLVHHGPVPGTYSRRRGLTDGAELCRLLGQCGAEMVLHGHGHRQIRNAIPHAGTEIPVFGVPSASYDTEEPAKRAGYNIYAISLLPDSWKVTVTTRSHDRDGQGFTNSDEQVFTRPAGDRA